MAKKEERWRELCALADPKKLMELVREITRLLELRDGSRLRNLEDDEEPDTKPRTES